MTEAKLAPNLPRWMEGHTNCELFSGGTEGHMYNTTLPRAALSESILLSVRLRAAETHHWTLPAGRCQRHATSPDVTSPPRSCTRIDSGLNRYTRTKLAKQRIVCAARESANRAHPARGASQFQAKHATGQ